MRASFLVCLVVAGCSASDPCDGLGGTCVSARVEGQPATLDQLRITVDGEPTSMLTPSSAGASFSLPVRLALAFTTAPGSSAAVTIDGLVGGNVVSTSGKQMVPLTAGGRSSFTFQLAPGGGDAGVSDGGKDGMAGGDMAPDLAPPPNVVSFEPSTFVFPDTPRGITQATQAMITFTNNTAKNVTASNINTTGDMNAFHFEPTTTCPMTQNTVGLGAGMTCTMVVSFTPDVTGPIEQDNAVMFDDGETLTLTFKGNGLRGWTVESSSSITTQFKAVWASSSSDWWAVGSDAACGIWHSTGNGQWQSSCYNVSPPSNYYAIGGSGANDVWVGGTSGDFWHYHGSATFDHLTTSSTGQIRGILMFSGASGLAVDNTGEMYCLGNGSPSVNQCSYSFNGVPQITSDTSRTPFSATSIGGVSVAGGSWAYVGGTAGNLWNHQPAPVQQWIGYSSSALTGNGGLEDVNGVLYLPNGNPPTTLGDLFAVGDFGGGNNGAIFHASNSVTQLEKPGGSQGPLYAVAGRIDPMTNKPDVYIVGGIGNQVLHTTGNGQYDQPQVGTQGSTYRSVWVTSDGQVMVVGDSGQIVHYY